MGLGQAERFCIETVLVGVSNLTKYVRLVFFTASSTKMKSDFVYSQNRCGLRQTTIYKLVQTMQRTIKILKTRKDPPTEFLSSAKLDFMEKQNF